jgi:hypothetical protein
MERNVPTEMGKQTFIVAILVYYANVRYRFIEKKPDYNFNGSQ